jgi:hypothetical protein
MMSTVQRAFELVESGRCGSMDHLRRSLRQEHCGDVEAHLASGVLRNQLMRLMASTAKARRGALLSKMAHASSPQVHAGTG